MAGNLIFTLYDEVQKVHPDISFWLAESIRLEYGSEVLDAFEAARVCVETDDPWESTTVFEKVCLVLNSRPVIGDVMQDLTTKEVAYAVKILKEQFPEDSFGDDVCRYISYVAGEEGLVVLPLELSFAQRFVVGVKSLSAEQLEVQDALLAETHGYVLLMCSLYGGTRVSTY